MPFLGHFRDCSDFTVLIQLSDIFHVTSDYLLGITHRKMIDVSDLNEEDMEFLLITIQTLRKKNSK